MAPTLVRTAATANGSGSPLTNVLGATPGAGRVLFANYYSSGGALTPAADTNGNALAVVQRYNPTSTQMTAAFAKTVGGSDNATTEVVDSGATTNRLELWEWAGLTTTLDDTVKTATVTSGTSLALGSITTTAPNSLIVAVIGFTAAIIGGSLAVSGGFTVSSTQTRMGTAYLIATTPGTYSPTASWTNSVRASVILFAYQAAAVTAAQKSVGFLGVL